MIVPPLEPISGAFVRFLFTFTGVSPQGRLTPLSVNTPPSLVHHGHRVVGFELLCGEADRVPGGAERHDCVRGAPAAEAQHDDEDGDPIGVREDEHEVGLDGSGGSH